MRSLLTAFFALATFACLSTTLVHAEGASVETLVARLASREFGEARRVARDLALREDSSARLALEAYLAPERTLGELDRGEVAARLDRLSSEDYDVREQATQDLLGLGIRVIPVLEETLPGVENLEIHHRIGRILTDLRAAQDAASPSWGRRLALITLGRIGSEASVPLLLYVLACEDGPEAIAADFALRAVLLDGPVPADDEALRSTAAEWREFLENPPSRTGDRFTPPAGLPDGAEVRARIVVHDEDDVDVQRDTEKPWYLSEDPKEADSDRMEILDRVTGIDPPTIRREFVRHENQRLGRPLLPPRPSHAGRIFRIRLTSDRLAMDEAGPSPITHPHQRMNGLGMLASWLVPPGEHARGAVAPCGDSFRRLHALLFVLGEESDKERIDVSFPGRMRYLGADAAGRHRFGLVAGIRIVYRNEVVVGDAEYWSAGFLDFAPDGSRVVSYRLCGPRLSQARAAEDAATRSNIREYHAGSLCSRYEEVSGSNEQTNE